jgi:hypothetical protein
MAPCGKLSVAELGTVEYDAALALQETPSSCSNIRTSSRSAAAPTNGF